MKKVLSLLLAVVMVIGMLPLSVITASAAETTTLATFTLGDDGSASHVDGSTATTYSETNNGYTLEITSGVKMYTGACDATGNGCIKFGTSSAVGSCTITVPSDVTEVVISVAKYKAKASKINVNGTAYTLTNSSNDGAYDEITVDTSAIKSISFTTVSGSARAMVNTIVFKGTAGGSSEPACTHENAAEQNDGYAATCTADGLTNSVYCPDCEKTVTAQTVITATGHSYADGVCSACGAADPAAGITEADTPIAGVAYKFGMRQNGLTDKPLLMLTGAMNGYYAATTTDVAEAVDTYLEATEGGYYIYTLSGTTKQYINIVVSGTYYNFKYEAAGSSVWTLNTEYKYVKTTCTDGTEMYLGTYGTNTTMSASKTSYISDTSKIGVSQFCGWFLTTESTGGDTVCEHTNTTVVPGTAATCTENGLTDGAVCSDCGVTVTEQEVITAPGHSFTDGTCSVCGATEPSVPDAPVTGNYILVTDIAEITSGGQFVIVANFNGVNYALAETISGKIAVVEVTVSEGMVAFVEGTTPVWTVAALDGNVALMSGDSYLGYSSSTNFAASADAYAWAIAEVSQGAFSVTAVEANTRGVAYQYNNGSPRFGAYATSNAESTDAYCFGLNFYKLTAGEVEVVESTVIVMENGTATAGASCEVGSTYTLPTATAPEGYTFAGWVEAEVTEETQTAPAEIYEAGTAYTVTGDVTFYALYTRTETVTGGDDAVGYVKVESALTDWSGDYLIAYEGESGLIVMNGSLETLDAAGNFLTLDVADKTVSAAAGDAYKFTIAAMDGGYSIKAASGKYMGHTADANKITSSDTEMLNTISMDAEGVISIICEGGAYLRYNKNSGQERFRYYKSTTYTSQQPVSLYKATAGAGAGSTEFTYYTTTVEGAVAPAAVCSVNGVTYASMKDALANYTAGSYVKMLADTDEEFTLTADLYIDLNGKTLSGTVDTAGYKIYGMDSATDNYTCDVMGYLACVDANGDDIVPEAMVQTSVTGEARRYLTIATGNGYTFHRFYLGLTYATVKPSTKGVGYKAVFAGDDMVKEKIDSFGYTLQLEGNDAVTCSKAGTEFVSMDTLTLRVDNYDAEKYGEAGLSASVFMTIDGQTVSTSAYTSTLKAMVERINELTLTDEQKTAMAAWIAESAVMQTWNVGNIYTAE